MNLLKSSQEKVFTGFLGWPCRYWPHDGSGWLEI